MDDKDLEKQSSKPMAKAIRQKKYRPTGSLEKRIAEMPKPNFHLLVLNAPVNIKPDYIAEDYLVQFARRVAEEQRKLLVEQGWRPPLRPLEKVRTKF